MPSSSSSSSSMGYESVSTRGGEASTSSSVCILTDHPLIPHMTSKLKLFTGGFVIEKSDAGKINTIKCIDSKFYPSVFTLNKANGIAFILMFLQHPSLFLLASSTMSQSCGQ